MKMKNHHGDRFENQMIVRKDNVKSKMLFFSFLLDEKNVLMFKATLDSVVAASTNLTGLRLNWLSRL